MSESITIVTTVHASKYLQQLCKHFGYKAEVEYSSTEGKISLPFGTCYLVASTDELMITATADFPKLSRVERVMSGHLARFSFRENLAVVWRPVTSIF